MLDTRIDQALRDLQEAIRLVDLKYAREHLQSGGSTTYDGTGSGSSSTTVQDALDELFAALLAHLVDALDSHDASSISVADVAGNFAGDDVEEVLAELFASLGAAAIDVEDEGVLLTAILTALDFVGRGVTATHGGGGAITVTVPGGATPDDTHGWMPLTTVVGGVPDVVWDANNSLIPTYVPFD
jgi:hypothetical protein